MSKADNVVSTLRSLGVHVESAPEELETGEIVATADLGTGIQLNAIAIGLGLKNVVYEPEEFPGLQYKFENTDVKVLIFGSGKAVALGGSSEQEARKAIEEIIRRLEELELLGSEYRSADGSIETHEVEDVIAESESDSMQGIHETIQPVQLVFGASFVVLTVTFIGRLSGLLTVIGAGTYDVLGLVSMIVILSSMLYRDFGNGGRA